MNSDAGRRQRVAAYTALVTSVALFSTIEIASKRLPPGIEPFALVFVRFFSTGIVLLLLAGRDAARQSARWTRRDLGRFALNGVIGVTIAISLFHVAIMLFTNAASSAVVFSANPVFVALLAPFMNREHLRLRTLVALAFGALGVACFAFESGHLSGRSLLGLGTMLLSAFFFAVSTCLSRRFVARYGAMVLMGFSALIGSLLVLPLAVIRADEGSTWVLLSAWPTVAYIALAGTACAYGLYYAGLARAEASRASLVFFLKPVLASAFAVILGEATNVYMVGGTALILVGLCTTIAPKPGGREERRDARGDETATRCDEPTV